MECKIFLQGGGSLCGGCAERTGAGDARVWARPAGEINTLQGNLNWVASREHRLTHPVWKNREADFLPLTSAAGSDSANLDAFAEFLVGALLPPVVHVSAAVSPALLLLRRSTSLKLPLIHLITL